MNYRFVLAQFGLLLVVLSAILIAMAAVFYALEWASGTTVDAEARLGVLFTAGIGIVLGGALWWGFRRGRTHLGRREAMLLVAMTWVLGAAFCALPYYFWAHLQTPAPLATAPRPDLVPPEADAWLEPHPFLSYVDCYFESMSGLTTTGATVLVDIPEHPRVLLLWRAVTHWLGGIGIIVLFVAVLPSLGVGGKRIYQLEAPGPSHEGVRPHIRETARVLWVIYLLFTVATAVALRLTGAMGWFDAICHAFSAVSTGGLSTEDASVAAYGSVAVDLILIASMFLVGVNFAIYYRMARGHWRTAWQDTEFRVYVVLKAAMILGVALSVWGDAFPTAAGEVLPGTWWIALHHGAFQVISLTSTGFVTANYDVWPYLAQAILFGLAFVGGCAGSTTGGVKVIRFWIALKVLANEFERAFRPQVVRPIRIGKTVVSPELKLSAVSYVLFFLGLAGAGGVAIMAIEGPAGPCDLQTAMSASMSCLANVGPGLHAVGPVETYAWMGPASKALLSLLMALGRLEMFAIAVLFLPRFWRAP